MSLISTDFTKTSIDQVHEPDQSIQYHLYNTQWLLETDSKSDLHVNQMNISQVTQGREPARCPSLSYIIVPVTTRDTMNTF